MFLAENSLSETRYPLGQELPGVPFAIKDNFSRSLVLSLRLLKGIPKGEILLKYKSSSLALINLFKVDLSTVVASGT